jgi:hypothetical protein
MRVYISGPMTGIADLNFPAFNLAAAMLRQKGVEAVNPAEVNPDSAMPWEQCMRADIKALCDCDTIALLPGWERSRGAHLEVHIAHRLGMRVVALGDLVAELRLAASDPQRGSEAQG